MCLPSCIAARVMQERTLRPSTWTVHAPHSPRSHAFFVPVKPSSSRNASSNVVRGSTVMVRTRPLTVMLTVARDAHQNSVAHDDRGVPVSMTVNGRVRTMTVEPRTTLLDALRDELGLTGTKKACDRGECGACTVHVDGRRVLSCMTLAAMQDGKHITTIEGLERDGSLHAMQAAFIEHDGFQCGFCTSGQIMSAVAMLDEAKQGWPSAATGDIRQPFTVADLSDAEIRERMAGNL